MEWLQELNDIGELRFKEYKSLKELELNTKYRIIKLEKTKDKFGYTIIAELEGCKVHLPKRLVDFLDEKKIKEFNKLHNMHLVVKEIKIINEKECPIVGITE